MRRAKGRRWLIGVGWAAIALAIGLACSGVGVPPTVTPAPTPTLNIETTTIKVYYPRLVVQDVEFVPVTRTVPLGLELETAKAALAELLKGPTEVEKGQGLARTIPAETRLLGLRLQGGVAYPDFSAEIEAGGSLRVMTISQSIRRTLLQFPSVKEVVIAVEGRTGDVLQP